MKRACLLFTLLVSTTFAEETTQRRLLQETPTAETNAKAQRATALTDNYEITLKMTEKDEPPIETALVTSSPEFRSTLNEQNLGFGGTLHVGEDGVVTVKFTMDWTVTPPPDPSRSGKEMVRTSLRICSYQGSVRLKDGEEIQILRTGSRKATLSVRKLVSVK